MKNIKIKNILMALAGAIVLGLGVGMYVKVGIGVDAVTAVYSGINKHTGLSIGTITALMNVLFVIIALILYKKNVGPATILFIFVSKFPIDFAEKYMIKSNNMIISILLCVLSIAVLALGGELFILSELGASSYDAITMGVGKRLKHEIKYVYVRYACDGTMLLIAFLLGGDIGLGTILCWLLIGNFMKWWQKVLVNALHLETNSVLN